MLRREFEFRMCFQVIFGICMAIKGCVAPLVEAPREGAGLHERNAFTSSPICSMTAKPIHQIAVLPRAPITGSPVPWLTSLYHKAFAGPYGDRRYPGNCSGELIKDLLRYFKPRFVLDPMAGSGTCEDVCKELGIFCESFDINDGIDATDPENYVDLAIEDFDFIWIHPPYWRQKIYSDNPLDLSTCVTSKEFLDCYEDLIACCKQVLSSEGKLAILMGDYDDREEGFVPLTYHTKRLAFDAGLRQHCTDIIRFSHGASSSSKSYRSSFIPGLHDTCMIFEKASIS